MYHSIILVIPPADQILPPPPPLLPRDVRPTKAQDGILGTDKYRVGLADKEDEDSTATSLPFLSSRQDPSGRQLDRIAPYLHRPSGARPSVRKDGSVGCFCPAGTVKRISGRGEA